MKVKGSEHYRFWNRGSDGVQIQRNGGFGIVGQVANKTFLMFNYRTQVFLFGSQLFGKGEILLQGLYLVYQPFKKDCIDEQHSKNKKQRKTKSIVMDTTGDKLLVKRLVLSHKIIVLGNGVVRKTEDGGKRIHMRMGKLKTVEFVAVRNTVCCWLYGKEVFFGIH